jgi:hypothetical protein
MRSIAVVILLLGLVGLVFGIIFIFQAGSAEQEIADLIQPLKISEVDGKYDEVVAKQSAIKAAEEPAIQAGQAVPSPMYNYLSTQRASLGLARANIGTAAFVRTMGIINIILGAGFVLTGIAVYRKANK